MPNIGSVIGHYRIVEKIGAGGMGEVYLAEDTALNRKVALKFLPPHLCQDPDCRARFTREAQAAAKLNHPNIVTIHDVGEHEGRAFIAMEYLEGASLGEYIKSKKLSWQEIIGLAIQIAEGIGEAHNCGIIHRDIKPSNILVDHKGRVKILDFGLAAIKGEKKLTQTGSTLGTLHYMSPEQTRGETVDERSDIFSLGAVIYEMITGQIPFRGDHEPAIMYAIAYEAPEPLARFKAGVSEEVQRIISKALAKDRNERYQQLDELLTDLKTELHRAVTVPGPELAKKRPARRFAIPASAVVIIIAVVLILKPWRLEISSTQEAAAEENRLAVMYFDNLVNPADTAGLGEIATNLLITGLSESQYIQVVSSQRLYDLLKLLGKEGIKRIDHDMATKVANKAKARWMILGSVLQMEPTLIITSQLVDVVTGNVKASKRIDGSAGEKIFPLIDRLITGIKKGLSLPDAATTEIARPVADITTTSTEAYRYYIQGLDNLYKYDYENAMASFKKSLQLDSTLVMPYYWLVSNMLQGDPEITKLIDKASRFADKATAKEKLYIESLQARFAGNHQLAIDKLKEIIKRYPEEKDAYCNIFDINYQDLNQAKEGLPYLSKVIEIDSTYKDGYNKLAYAYNDAGDFEKAIWAINKYIALAPNEFNPYDTRGEIYALNGRLDDAIASYEKAASLAPDDPEETIILGRMYLYKRWYSKADSCFKLLASSSIKDNRPAGRRSLAFVLMYQGKFNQALRVLENGIGADKLDDQEWKSVHKMTDKMAVYYELRQFDSAISQAKMIMEVARKVDPEDKLYWRDWYAMALAKNRDFIEADKILSAIRRDIDESDNASMTRYWTAMGWVEFEKGIMDSALANFRRIGGSYTVARACLESGNLAEAIATYERVQSEYGTASRWLQPIADVKSYYYLGQAYEKSGWTDKAIQQYETFLDIWKDADPGLPAVDDAKARLARLKVKT
jgi:serine/threonine protein kinase/Flp pilus assembly protein TadD